MFDVFVETGARKVFVSALDWPGWARGARDEDAALQALADYGARYAAALKGSRTNFKAPRDVAGLRVAERAKGNATTDFGAPAIVAAADARPMDARERARQENILRACWAAFDAAAQAARGATLRKGPRGGGRDLAKMRAHVAEAEWDYVRALGGAPPKLDVARHAAIRAALLGAVEGRLDGSIPPTSPRGRAHWPPRFAIRRAAWHMLDHAWEIEDRRT